MDMASTTSEAGLIASLRDRKAKLTLTPLILFSLSHKPF